MANPSLKHPLNSPGPLYVDSSCIDCGTCYHIGPKIFDEDHEASYVKEQPVNLDGWTLAKAAIISCPTNSIGVKSPPPEFREAVEWLPHQIAKNVYYCGYTARSSFGATSYLIRRPEGNILVDSPRFHPHLVKKLEDLGGVKWMYLSHQDDVADHAQFAEHFKCQRIIHRLEVTPSTQACEMILEGKGDWELAEDLKILFTPGHTEGHLCLLYQNEFLFTGDHLFYSAGTHHLYASQSVNWYSWPCQKESLRKLLSYQFHWILPGHGGWVKKGSTDIHKDLLEITK